MYFYNSPAGRVGMRIRNVSRSVIGWCAMLLFALGLPSTILSQSGDPVIRLLSLDTDNETVTIKNFGAVAEDVSDYQFCLGPGQYNALNDYANISGDLTLEPGEELTFDLTSGGGGVTALPDDASGLVLFTQANFGSSDPADLEDYVQYGAPNQDRVNQAVAAGRWDSADNFVDGDSPYNFVGQADDFGSSFWQGSIVEVDAIIRLLVLDTDNETVTIKNFGAVTEDVSDYQFCLGPGQYNALNDYANISGDLTLEPGEELTFDLTSGGGGVTALPDDASGLVLFTQANFGSSDPADLEDYVQYGAPNQDRVNQAVAAGRWDSADNFVDGDSPYNFVGQADDFGSSFWQGSIVEVDAIIRLLVLDTDNETVTIKNFGAVTEEVSDYQFCLGPGQYNALNDYANISGDLTLEPGEELTFDLTSGGGGVTALPDDASGLVLFTQANFGSSDPADLEDYVQYGAPNQDRVNQAVAAGRWDSADNFVDGDSPYNFVGQADDFGSSFWQGSIVEVDAIIRLLVLDTDNETVTIKNFGAVTEDVSDYQFCLGPGQYNALNDYANISGDLTLEPGEELTFDLTSGGGNATQLPDANGALALFSEANFGSSDPDDLEDYVQWGAPGQARVNQAVAAGRWDSADNFVAGNSPYTYVGGANDVGSPFWIDDTVIRMVKITPETDEVVLRNFDDIERDLSNYFFCTQAGVYPRLGNPAQAEILSGDLTLAPGEEVTVRVLTAGGVIDNTGGLFLFSSNVLGFNNTNPAVLRDFAQWGAPNGFRVDNAVAAGRWDSPASFIAGDSPFNYIGDADDIGAAFWEATLAGEQVIRFDFTDADNNVLISGLSDGAVIDLGAFDVGAFNIQAITDPEIVGSVVFNISGPLNQSPTENVFPYFLFGDAPSSGTNNAQTLPVGTYQLTATPFSGSNGTGTAGAPLTIAFEVVDEAAGDVIERFRLADENNTTLDDQLEDGDVIDLSVIGDIPVNIEAITDPAVVGSVTFTLTGPDIVTRTENIAPYFLFGDSPISGNIRSEKLAPGQYQLTAQPFSQPGGNGTPGEARTIQFEVVNGGSLFQSNSSVLNAAHATQAGAFKATVFPNPATGQATIVLQGDATGRTRVQVADQTGRVLRSLEFRKEFAGAQQELDLSGLPAGVYFLHLTMEEKTETLRLVVHQ